MRREEIVLLEELNFNAWPALRTAMLDGWLLRSTGNDSRRVNSVNPFVPGVLPLGEKIGAAEAIYARWGRRTFFRLTPLAESELDSKLAERGYAIEGQTFVQVGEAVAFGQPPDVQVLDRPHDAWIDAARVVRELESSSEIALLAAQHRAIGIDSGWAVVGDGEHALGVGVVGVERGWAGLHGIYVAKAGRGRGLARKLTEALIGYASRRGARRVWLQVDQTNAAALSLYASLGFSTAYTYHYRSRAD